MLSCLTTSLAKKRHRPDEQALSQTFKTIFSFLGGNVSVECFKLNWRSFFDGAYLYTLLIPRMGRCDISSKKYKRNQRGFGEKWTLRAIPCDRLRNIHEGCFWETSKYESWEQRSSATEGHIWFHLPQWWPLPGFDLHNYPELCFCTICTNLYNYAKLPSGTCSRLRQL